MQQRYFILFYILLLSMYSNSFWGQINSPNIYYSEPFYKTKIFNDQDTSLKLYIGIDTFEIIKRKNQYDILKNNQFSLYYIHNTLYDNQENNLINKRKNIISYKNIEYKIVRKNNGSYNIEDINKNILVNIDREREGTKRYLTITNNRIDPNVLLVGIIYYCDRGFNNSNDWLYGFIGNL